MSENHHRKNPQGSVSFKFEELILRALTFIESRPGNIEEGTFLKDGDTPRFLLSIFSQSDGKKI